MPTVRRKIFGPRTIGITTFLERIATTNSVKLENVTSKKRFLRETVSYAATGEEEALAKFIAAIDQAIKEHDVG